jgi:hypothetical protein
MKGKKGNGSVFQRGAVGWVKYHRNGKVVPGIERIR